MSMTSLNICCSSSMYRKSSVSTITVTKLSLDDGYVWRKYGQKAVLNSKYPRYLLFMLFCYFCSTIEIINCAG
jgi:WRKY DNA -binding domain